MLRPITTHRQSEAAFNLLRKGFAQEAKRYPDHRVGFQGGGHTCDVYWHGKYGIWGLFERFEEKSRYWICYGLQNPAFDSMLTITVETNPPIEGVNRRCAGIFLRDDSNHLFIAHSGKVGGGRKGIGKKAFRAYTQDAAWIPVKWPKGDQAEARVIARLDDNELVFHIASFVNEVAAFKRFAVKA